ncbi:DUF3122 domain-containing protein [Leptolyngbya sp. AN02str]|uniref:DUF3122 domain-containing protein n=1 Tax=Leptolyngbya sp. AN02str TaxID=3423363 RepID=UPI003D31AD69
MPPIHSPNRGWSLHAGVAVGRILMLMLVLGAIALTAVPTTAWASIHRYPEAEGRVMFRSLQTLRDETGRAWQTVLFKRVEQGMVQSVSLRLVGFPGEPLLAHPRSLSVGNGSTTWQAPDRFEVSHLDPALADTVGEYDVWPILTELSSNAPLTLNLPIQSSVQSGSVQLVVPPFAVREWRQLLDASDADFGG